MMRWMGIACGVLWAGTPGAAYETAQKLGVSPGVSELEYSAGPSFTVREGHQAKVLRHVAITGATFEWEKGLYAAGKEIDFKEDELVVFAGDKGEEFEERFSSTVRIWVGISGDVSE